MTVKPQGLSISATIVMFIMMEHMHVTTIIVRVKRARNYRMMRALGSTLNGARRWPVATVITDTGDDRRKHFLKWEAS